MSNTISPEFKSVVNQAWQMSRQAPDDSMRYMADNIPIWVLPKADPQKALAGGCPTCTYLGLWADQWPGYQSGKHGIIFLFEDGIRGLHQNLLKDTYEVLTHEMGHALQRDHVLDEMQKLGMIGAQTGSRGCGQCPGRQG